jgi:hypothetical protein
MSIPAPEKKSPAAMAGPTSEGSLSPDFNINPPSPSFNLNAWSHLSFS